MTVELTAAQLDAQADEALKQMEATGWQAPEASESGTDESKSTADADAASTESKADDAPSSEQQASDENAEGKTDDALDLAALEEIANPKTIETAYPLQFNVHVPSDYKTARAALMNEKNEAFAKVMEGELDHTEYAAIEARVMESLEDLSAQRIRAETLLEANAQNAAQSQNAAIQALIVKAKDIVPYATDTKAQKQFDKALSLEIDDPDNAGKSFAYLVNEAHKAVLAKRGLQEKHVEQNKAPERKSPDVPVTLGGLPNAGGSGEKSVTQVLAGLSGPDFDKAFDALPKDQQQKYLKQA